jgi:hypothetical protein
VPRQQYQHVVATMPRRQLKALRETFKGGSGGVGSSSSSSSKGVAKQGKAAAKADSKAKGKGRSATAKGAEGGGGVGDDKERGEEEEDEEEDEEVEVEEEEEEEDDEDDDTDEDEAAEAEAERQRSALAAKAAREAGYLEESEEEEEEDGGAGGAKLTSELGSAFGLATRVRPGAVAGESSASGGALRKRRALVHLGCVAHTLTVSPDLEAMLAEADAAAREQHGPIMGGGLTHASRLLQEYLALGPGEGSALMRARRAGGRRERAESAESMA